MKRAIGITTFLLASAAAFPAQADIVNWVPGVLNYTTGIKPAVAGGYIGQPWEIEVHQAAPGVGALWSDSAFGNLASGPDYYLDYTTGTAPAIATYDWGNP
jgi:hypothetical protein